MSMPSNEALATVISHRNCEYAGKKNSTMVCSIHTLCPPCRSLAEAFDAAVADARRKALEEAAEYIVGYAAAVRRAGHTDTANTLIAVKNSIDEIAARAKEPKP
jgi:hypothetical protein